MTLTDACSNLFLFLVTFRRQVRKGMSPDMNQVRSQLLEIFTEQERLVQDDANLARLYERVKYILIVLADEILINSNWTYSSAWEEAILEWEFFKTRIAGEEFFNRLEREGETDEKLAEIYYLALCLGFVGQYNDNPTKILDLKRRLYRMLPGRFSDQDTKVTPDAYYVAEGAKDIYKPLVNLGRIAAACAVLFIGLWAVYFFYRREVTRDIKELAKEMKGQVPPPYTAAAAKEAAKDDEKKESKDDKKPSKDSDKDKKEEKKDDSKDKDKKKD